jgi:hypothetical protein
MFAAGVACISRQVGIEDLAEQRKFVAAFCNDLVYGPALLRTLAADNKAVIFTRENLLALFRIAIVGMSDGSPEANVRDVFTRAALIVNGLVSEEITPRDSHRDFRDMLPTELRSIITQPPQLFIQLGRSDAFVEWLQTPAAEGSAERLPVLEDFREFTGLSTDEFAASAWVTLARSHGLANWDTVDAQGVAFNLDEWLKGVAQQDFLRQFFRVNAVFHGGRAHDVDC